MDVGRIYKDCLENNLTEEENITVLDFHNAFRLEESRQRVREYIQNPKVSTVPYNEILSFCIAVHWDKRKKSHR